MIRDGEGKMMMKPTLRIKSCFVPVMVAVMLLLASCDGGNSAAPTSTAKPTADAGVDHTKTGIGVMMQEYKGNDIVEILMITYDASQKALEKSGGKNGEIDRLNNSIKAGPQRIYEEHVPDGHNRIEIRSYPFQDEEYVQIVTSCVVLPETRPDLYSKLWSYNFSKKENRVIGVDEMLQEHRLTKEAIEEKFVQQYKSEYATVVDVDVTGFLLDRTLAKPVTRFLLEVELVTESDPYKGFFLYTPENDAVEELDPELLFDPAVYDMVAMDPPLAYARPDLAPKKESPLKLTINTVGMEEIEPGSEYILDELLYIELQSFPRESYLAYDDDTMRARLKDLEGSDIRVFTVTLSDEYTALLSYPTWMLVYEAGRGKDTMLYKDLYIQTDNAEYRVHTRVPAEYELRYHDETGFRFDTIELIAED